MKRLRLLGIALIAIFAMSAIAATTASASNPEILPLPTAEKPLKFTSESVKGTLPELETTKDLKIVCEKLKNNGSFTSGDAGTITLDFEKCKSNGVGCNTEGDIAELILLTDATQLVTFKTGTVLELGILVSLLSLPKNLLIKCGVGLSIEVKGDVLGKMDNVKDLVKTTTALALFHKIALGEQEIKTCELLAVTCLKEGKPIELKLDANFGKGFELAVEVTEDNITFTQEAEVHF